MGGADSGASCPADRPRGSPSICEVFVRLVEGELQYSEARLRWRRPVRDSPGLKRLRHLIKYS